MNTSLLGTAYRLATAPPAPPAKAAKIKNPLDDIVPDFTIFGAEFTTLWQKIASGLWGLAILIAVGYLAHGMLGIAQNRGSHPAGLRESKKEAVNAGVALGGLLALAIIVGVFIKIVG